MTPLKKALSSADAMTAELSSILDDFERRASSDVTGAGRAARQRLDSADFAARLGDYEHATIQLRALGVGSDDMARCLDGRILSAHATIDGVSRSAASGAHAANVYLGAVKGARAALNASCDRYLAEAEEAEYEENEDEESGILPWVLGAGAVVAVGVVAWWAFGSKG